MPGPIKAVILEVMESWPLELLVETGGVKRTVGLAEDATAIRQGESVDLGVLRPGMVVLLQGDASSGDSHPKTARRVEIP